MKVAHCGVLLALLCYLLCAPNAAATVGQLQTCTIQAVGDGYTVGTAVTYNNCSQLCCATRTVSATAADALVGCCHDAATNACPSNLGLSCCLPATAVSTAYQQKRSCYSEATQGCCRWTERTWNATDGSPIFTPTSQTYWKDTQQCCALPGTIIDASDSDPITPKYVFSCTEWLAQNANTRAKCSDSSTCPMNDGVQGSCCRRPRQTVGETTTEYDRDHLGNCYDSKVSGCCGGSATGDAHIQYGNSTHYNVTYSDEVIYNKYVQQCCKLPSANAGGWVLPLSSRCPCMKSADCPTAGHTCCAPTEVELTSAGGSTRRNIKCDPGCPQNNIAAGGRDSYFQGCLGLCMASSTGISAENEVCLAGPEFKDRCANLRFRVNGDSFQPPSPDAVSTLIKKDREIHGWDCCLSNRSDANYFSVWYDTTREVCCPVIGTGVRTGINAYKPVTNRFLSPVVYRQNGLTDANVDACLCMDDADCPGEQRCCQHANSRLARSAGARALEVMYKNYTGLCYDHRVTSCCNYKFREQQQSPTTIDFGVLYVPTQAVCCPHSGLSATPAFGGTGQCECHEDADCPSAHHTCCTAAERYGNMSHTRGMCIDTRFEACCRYAEVEAGSGQVLVEKDAPTWQATNAVAYNPKTQVCCPWNGPMADVRGCTCRFSASDCPGTTQCCAGNRTDLARGGIQYNATGRCFDPSKQQACCDWKNRPYNSAVQVYEKNKHVCCPLNGIQHDHRHCECAASGDCPADGECCTDAQAAAAGFSGDCSAGPGRWCPGRCIHKEIETCCDNPHRSEWSMGLPVLACASASQKCCEGACCNKAIESCKKTAKNTRTLTRSVWHSHFDSSDDDSALGYHIGLDEEAKKCTVLEHSSPSIVFHTWVFPTFLSVACIAFMVIGTRAAFTTDISPNVLKLGLVGLEIFVGIMSLLLLWSPLWKYGFVIVVANTVILSSFAVAGVWPRRFAVVVAVVCFLWVVEPFGTNSILNFGTTTYAGNQMKSDGGEHGSWFNAHGLNYAARLLQRPREYPSLVHGASHYEDACTTFYQYWRVDPELHDARTWNPYSPTRGICRRSWMHTIVVMAGLITPFQTVFLLLAGLAIARATSATKDMKVQPLA